MSRHIVRSKNDYYGLLQAVREDDAWEEWVLYMLTAIEETARQGISTIDAIKNAIRNFKHRIRARYAFYSQDLINNLFSHPYTKIQFVMILTYHASRQRSTSTTSRPAAFPRRFSPGEPTPIRRIFFLSLPLL